MHTMKIIDTTGHTAIEWSTDLEQTVRAANEMFNQLLANGYNGFEMEGSTGKQMPEFNPDVKDILMVPPMVGG